MQVQRQITDVTTATDRLREALDEHKIRTSQGQKEVAKASGYRSQGAIGNALGRGSLPKKLSAVAKVLGVRVEWIESGTLPKYPGLLAQPVRPDSVMMTPTRPEPPVIQWRGMKANELPEFFRVPAPDDAMADRVHKGWMMDFDRSLRPRQGDGVLVATRDGTWFFRLYSEGIDDNFEAIPLNRNHQSFNKADHGLTVLAVLVGVPSRWSSE